ncbi:MAG: glutathione peroxidase [Sulfurimonas sp.]|nr:glutathione peroxidase [Sulfurimonas sp.]
MSIYDYKVKMINGKEISMSRYKGKVLLIVNVASTCGMTPQYEGLQKLFKTYKKKGFMVLGFPSNEFGDQESQGNEEIAKFCKNSYQVGFDMFEKVKVNGDDAIPLYNYLKEQKKGFLWSKKVKWNFTKFLVDAKGNVLKRYASPTTPASIQSDIEELFKNS